MKNLASIYAISSSLLSFNRALFSSKTVFMPNIADSITEGTIAELLKREGQWVNMDDIVGNVETDKITAEVKTPYAGLLEKFHVKVGDNLAVGKPFFDVDIDAKKAQGETSSSATSAPTPSKPTTQQVSQPSSQSFNQASRLNQSANKASHQSQSTAKVPSQPSAERPKQSAVSTSGKTEERTQVREPMSRLRQRVAQRLKQSQNNYALLTTFQQVDMLATQNARKELGEDFLKKHGVKLGFMSFFMKAATLALQEYPLVNSVIDGNEIVKKNYIDISVAVAGPSGLLVPVVRNCQSKRFHEFEKQLGNLAKKAKEGKISIEEMQGGTFTISNGGTFGSLMGTPILNPPQSAILGMHSIVNRPVVRGNEIVARPIMYLALTYDHRLLDGKDAVIFLKSIQKSIQDPRRMLLDL